MKRLLSILIAPMACGCWAPKQPITEFRINPITHTASFSDSKDNHVILEGLEFNGVEKSGSLDRLEIDNSASSVIAMQIKQMEVWNQQMQTANDGIKATLAGLQNIVGAMTPMAMQYMQTRQAIATDAPGAAKILDSAGRLIGTLNGGIFTPAPTSPPVIPPVLIPGPPPPAPQGRADDADDGEKVADVFPNRVRIMVWDGHRTVPLP